MKENEFNQADERLEAFLDELLDEIESLRERLGRLDTGNDT